jgi:serine beta-lactamase-like protein LACTB, mitochondrial
MHLNKLDLTSRTSHQTFPALRSVLAALVTAAYILFLGATPVIALDTPYALADRVDAKVQTEIKRQEIVSLAVVVIDDGKIAWTKGYGFADRDKKAPVDPALTQFRWASISKSVTAIAALQLVEKGLLDLDVDIRTYVPEFPDKGAKITARDLLRHQGGIVHYANGRVVRTERTYSTPHPFADVIVALDKFKDSPLINTPGTKYSYSTHGYILLSAVVERAGKQKFADQVTARIAKPLGMADFRPDYQWEDIPHRAAGYTRQDGVINQRPNNRVEDVSWKLGGGGFTSPTIDLARFGLGLLQRKLVSESTERLMWTINKPTIPDGADAYGLGFFVISQPDGRTLVGHDGSQQNAKTALLLDPKARKGIALMTSSEWVDVMNIATILMDEIR